MRITNTWRGIAVWLLLLHTCQFALMGCGGSGGSDDPDPVPTSRQVAEKFAEAETKGEKEGAFRSLFVKIRVGTNDAGILGKSARPTDEAISRISQVLASEDPLTRGPKKSVETIYAGIERPDYGLNFSVPVATVVAQFNAELANMDANPESPNNCLIRLATYNEANPEVQPPTISETTQLTANQAIAFSIWALKFADGADNAGQGRWIIFPLLLTLAIVSVVILVLAPLVDDIIDWLEDLFDDEHDQGTLGLRRKGTQLVITYGEAM